MKHSIMDKHGGALIRAALLVLAAAVTAGAEVQLPRVIGNNMVLQRNQPVPIWGWDQPGQEVTVSLGEHSASVKAGENGRWLVRLPAREAGGPFDVLISGSSTVELRNVMFGEVWVCSGQSNMEMTSRYSTIHPELLPREAKPIDVPRIRHLWLPTIMSPKPLGDDGVAEGITVFGKKAEQRPAVLMPRPPDRPDLGNYRGEGWQTNGFYTQVGYWFARRVYQDLRVPIGLIHSSWGGSPIESWIPAEAMETIKDLPMGPLTRQPHFRSSVIYNGMIHPVHPYGIRGVIWYQGESNGHEDETYVQKKRTMIESWRKAWGQGDFPFYFVQLPNYVRHGLQPPYAPDTDPAGGDGWARIREAQGKAAARIKNTGMAVTIDIGEAGNIHPRNKRDVGTRLALWALKKDYGNKELVHSGPIYKSMKTAGKTIELTFDHVGGGLMAAKIGELLETRRRDVWYMEPPERVDKLEGFAVAGADQKWHLADAVIRDDKVIVSSDKVDQPVAVRYAFSKNPYVTLYNREGLPAAPFRTDTWEFIRYRDHTLSSIVK